jgi:hypothetical protein
LYAYFAGIPFTYPNIPENKEIGLPDSDYLRCGNVEELASKLQQVIVHPQEHVEYDMSKYDWGKIADQTGEAYKKMGI